MTLTTDQLRAKIEAIGATILRHQQSELKRRERASQASAAGRGDAYDKLIGLAMRSARLAEVNRTRHTDLVMRLMRREDAERAMEARAIRVAASVADRAKASHPRRAMAVHAPAAAPNVTSHRTEPSGHKRQTQGRYTKGRQDVVPGDLPAKGRPQSVLGEHVTIGHGAVPDPNPAFRGGRQVVAINLRTDVLEQEYAYKRISEAAYQAGRAYQAVLERAARAGGGQWREGDRVDQIIAHEAAVLDGIATAEMIVTMKRAARAIVGATGERLLGLILGERLTLRRAAVRMGCSDSAQSGTACGWAFRRALEDLAAEWAAVGALPARRE